MHRVFIDMDGVLVDYASKKLHYPHLTHEEFHQVPEIFRHMQPMQGALAAITEIERMGFDVWIASLPPPHAPTAYTAKALWVQQHAPRLLPKLILTPDKGLLGDAHDFLVDDRPHAANCMQFKGTFIKFEAEPSTAPLDDQAVALPRGYGWDAVVTRLRGYPSPWRKTIAQ